MRLTKEKRELIRRTLCDLQTHRPTFCRLVAGLLDCHPMPPAVSGDELDAALARRAARVIAPCEGDAEHPQSRALNGILLALVRMEATQREIRDTIAELRLGDGE